MTGTLSDRWFAWVLVGLLLGGTSCTRPPLETVRDITYPPDLHYITRAEIRGLMGNLAAELYALDGVLAREGGPGSDDREPVVAILARMESLAGQLKKREHSNHPRVDAFAPRLQHNIHRALVGARKQPPNYYFAGQVSGSCSYCHAPSSEARLAPGGFDTAP